MLPGIDGFNICRQIRKVKETPILLVSAKREEIDKIRGLGLGADDYIVKPFSPNELVARVKSHIARYERLTVNKSHNNTLNFGELEINLDAHRVFVNGNEVILANREFELLTFLAQNPNILFSREKLFERIWGLDALGDSATVTVHINRIREKIEQNPNTFGAQGTGLMRNSEFGIRGTGCYSINFLLLSSFYIHYTSIFYLF